MRVKLDKVLKGRYYFVAKDKGLENYIDIKEMVLSGPGWSQDLRGKPMIRVLFVINGYEEGREFNGWLEKTLEEALSQYYDRKGRSSP